MSSTKFIFSNHTVNSVSPLPPPTPWTEEIDIIFKKQNWEIEAGRSEAQGHSCLGTFKTKLGCTAPLPQT